MILLNFFIGFFSIFISPQIFIYYTYRDLHYSLVLIYGVIVSFTMGWILFLLTFYFDLSHIFLFLLSLFVFCCSVIYLLARSHLRKEENYLSWLVVVVLLLPLLFHMGEGFMRWDAVVSWNRWALEIYNNVYHPMRAAYPILFPSLWGLFYKIQGTDEIWWTVKLSLFFMPLMVSAIIFTLYKETKNNTFLYMGVLIYPYLLWEATVSGMMDVPVMLVGFLCLITLYAAETHKGKASFEYYVYAALLLGGIASIVKQSGLVFVVFVILYLFLNRTFFKNRKKIFVYIILSLLYFISFLIIYYHYQGQAFGNIDHLKHLSHQQTFEGKSIKTIFLHLWDLFFSYPPTISWLGPLLGPLNLSPVTPFLIGFGLILFLIKDLRKFNSVGFLSGIFFIIGIIVWVKYFSYSPRNSYWIKSFFIVFTAININYFFTHYFRIGKIKNIFFLIFLSSIFIFSSYLMILGDDYAYAEQKKFQKKLGDTALAKKMNKILSNSNSDCLLFYTANQPTVFNYYLKDAREKVRKVNRWSLIYAINHTCREGRYISFVNFKKHEITKQKNWDRVMHLIKNRDILPVGSKSLKLFFVPPNIIEMENKQ